MSEYIAIAGLLFIFVSSIRNIACKLRRRKSIVLSKKKARVI